MNLFTQAWEYLRVRGQLLSVRGQEVFYWFRRQMQAVQIAVVLMLGTTLVSSLLTKWFETNTPARYGMVVSYLIYLYVVRKIVGPIFFIEFGMTIWRRGVALLPSWLHWLAPPPTTGGVPDTRLVWHETSMSGNIFHMISTIWMWAEVFLFVCGVFPVWEGNNYSAVAMITVMVLLFVATEDFVNIRVWRTRLAYATMVIGLTILVPMTFQVLAPGSLKLQMAKWNAGQTEQTMTADAVTAQTTDDAKYLESLYQEDRSLRRQYRAHQAHDTSPTGSYDKDWTLEKSKRWQKVAAQVDEYRAGQAATAAAGPGWAERFTSSSKDWFASLTDSESSLPWVLGVLAIGTLVLFRSPKRSTGH